MGLGLVVGWQLSCSEASLWWLVAVWKLSSSEGGVGWRGGRAVLWLRVVVLPMADRGSRRVGVVDVVVVVELGSVGGGTMTDQAGRNSTRAASEIPKKRRRWQEAGAGER